LARTGQTAVGTPIAGSVVDEPRRTTTDAPCPAWCRAPTSFCRNWTASRRGWPGQARPRAVFGWGFRTTSPPKRLWHVNRTAMGLTRPSPSSPWMPGTSPGMTVWERFNSPGQRL